MGTGPFAALRSASIRPTRVIPRGLLPSGVLRVASTACFVAATLCGDAGELGDQLARFGHKLGE
jgi:hypothetical protein